MIVTPPLKTSGGGGSTSVYLPPGTTNWTVPPGVTNLIAVECWGAGGSPSGGGAYAAIANYSVTPGQVISTNVPAGNAGTGADSIQCWFAATTTVRAQNASNLGPIFGGGQGGTAAGSIGTVKFSGGNAGVNSCGGGGAAGPNANGANGGSNTDRFHGSAGGGGANGGTVGASVDGATQSGGNGGKNSAGQVGGAGGAAGSPGINAVNPGSGGGGAGNANNGAANNGGNGAADQDHGGGGGGAATEDITSHGAVGGAGGAPGGGGGNSRFGTIGTAAGGQIKITY